MRGAQPRQRTYQCFGLEDPGVRRKQRGERPDVRLTSSNEPPIDEYQAFDTVGITRTLQPLESRDFALGARHNQLAAALYPAKGPVLLAFAAACSKFEIG